ncbi:MAG: PHP domain-containing protein [Prevotellaceae bacterium]|nr:PHP domain-containing protein [Prevotellaceae bacterium]
MKINTLRICLFTFVLACFCIFNLNAQSYSIMENNEVVKLSDIEKSDVRNIVNIPNISGYYTLKCDLHTHTVFSDGDVWPDVRVKEAWQHGLDAIAITDHIEYRPHKDMLNGDHNESYKIAKKKGDALGVIVIKGAEVTRSKPLGHLNALFIQDANLLDVKEPLDAINEAVRQDAFILWNHPGWPDNKSTLYPVHEQLIKDKKIHGVEVFNYNEYYPVVFDWCKNYSLAFTANSDIHYLVKEMYGANIRPMTLVFASERSEKGVRDALFAGRTAAYFNGYLAAKTEYLYGLLEASLKIKLINPEKRKVEITNISDISYRMTCGDKLYVFPAGKAIQIEIPKEGKVTVTNCFTGMNEHLAFNVSDINL